MKKKFSIIIDSGGVFKRSNLGLLRRVDQTQLRIVVLLMFHILLVLNEDGVQKTCLPDLNRVKRD